MDRPDGQFRQEFLERQQGIFQTTEMMESFFG
jgi:hypothetical protein